MAADAKVGNTMVEEDEGVSDGDFGASDDDDRARHAVHRGTRRSSSWTSSSCWAAGAPTRQRSRPRPRKS